MSDTAILTINGARWRGWTEISVQRSVEQLAGRFDLTLTDSAAEDGALLRLDITPGAGCSVEITGEAGEARVITGHVDRVEPSYDAKSHVVRVSGRDATGDLVDCSAVHPPSGEFKDADALAIATALAKPFGIRVCAAVNVGAAFATFRVQEGETVHEAIGRACRCRALLAISDGLGGLVLTRGAQARRVDTVLRRGAGGILKAEGGFDLSGRFSAITTKGQASLDDAWGAAEATAAKAEARDGGVPRHRPLVVVVDDLAEGQTLADRATWEMATRIGRSRRAEITVPGWRDGTGQIWAPLTRVTVKDDWLGIDGPMLIAGVTLTKDDNGTLSRLSLVGPDAYDLVPLKEKTEEEPGW